MFKLTRKCSASLVTVAFVTALCLSAAVQAQQPSTANPRSYDIRDYGAIGDGKTLDSPAIDRAIEACAEAGGGTVRLSAGTYLSGSIHLKSNVHLYLDGGAVILGAPQNMNAYDPVERFEGKAYQDGGHTYFHNSLIWGENLTNISITGPGMINGGGLTASDGPLGMLSGYSHPRRGQPVPDPNVPVRLGNKAIALKLCRQVLIRDITIYHGGHFAVITTGKRNRGPNVTTVSRVRNIIISNVIATGVSRNSGIQVTGMPDHPIEDVRLDNIWLRFEGGGTEQNAAIVPSELDTGYPEPRGTMPGYGVFARHVRGLELANFHLSFEKTDQRPPMVCVDVDGLEIDNFKAQVAAGVTPARFEQVKGLVVRDSPVLDGLSSH